jgi:hypothetical protein
MLTPTFELLKAMSQSTNFPRKLFFGCSMHQNPRFYKYEWRIFWEGSTTEKDDFLKSTPMATNEALCFIRRLDDERKPCIIYCSQRRRLGIAIWNYTAPRILLNGAFAPAYDNDPDPPTEDGHK